MKLIGKGSADSRSNLKIPGTRRADRFAKMAVKACLKAAGEFSPPSGDTGVIVATRFGPHATTFKFLDGLLDYSDTEVSPTTFSHSVHNAAASYIAAALGIRGPALTLTCFEDPLSRAFELVPAWLELDRAGYVFVCFVEEKSGPFDAIQTKCPMPPYSKNGITEGAAAFLLTRGDGFAVPESIGDVFIAFDLKFD